MISKNDSAYLINSYDRLYKYTSISNIPSTLKNGVYAGRIQDLNDPYESKDIENCDNYRICALSSSRDANLMWAHYANSHKGCSMQINIAEYLYTDSVLRKVKYQDRYINRMGLFSEKEIIESLYCKDDKWKDEREVRAVYSKYFSDPNQWRIADEKVFFNARVTKIKFGCMVDAASNEYREALRAIYSYNLSVLPNEQIKVQKMTMKDGEYRFVADHSYSFESELERLGITKELVVAG